MKDPTIVSSDYSLDLSIGSLKWRYLYPVRFSTKVDLWILAVLSLAPVALIAGSAASRDWRVAVGGLAYLGLLSLIVWPCEYRLEDKELVVRSGLIKWRIAYDQIQKVEPTRNPLSSPAWSLDRLRIDYGSKWMMVSPSEQARFLAELGSRAKLRQYGKAWKR